jgi:hypothetical protein
MNFYSPALALYLNQPLDRGPSSLAVLPICALKYLDRKWKIQVNRACFEAGRESEMLLRRTEYVPISWACDNCQAHTIAGRLEV